MPGASKPPSLANPAAPASSSMPPTLSPETGRIWPPPFYLEGDVAPSAPTGEEVAASGPISSAEAPVTAAPHTLAPITTAPITAAPITAAPITTAPITTAPITAAPMTAPPATAPPATIPLGSMPPPAQSSRLPPPLPKQTPAMGMGRVSGGAPVDAPSSTTSLRPAGSIAPAARGGATPATFGVVAFLGTGSMGIPMAASIAKKGFALSVWNRTRERANSLVTLGAKLKVSPAECAQGARVVVTMLADERALTDVLNGPAGVLTTLPQDTVVVDMSTIGRAGALRVAQLVRDAGGRFIDAPVSGSPSPAEKGELIALVGGKLNDITRAQPVLLAMCKRILHAGDVGQGQALKILLNGIGIQQLVALTSMIALGEKVGLARRTLLEALASSPYASPSFNARKEKLVAKDFSPETSLETALRETRLNAELEQEAGLPLAVQRELLRTLEKAVEEGLGPEDLFALEKYFKL